MQNANARSSFTVVSIQLMLRPLEARLVPFLLLVSRVLSSQHSLQLTVKLGFV
jgi:hypothetical protein